MEFTTQFIDSLAPNAAAASNGKALAKGKFRKLCISTDQTVLFGECAGSGKTPYSCSVDFLDAANPVGRCSCPSRQIPCKHALGLLYAYAAGSTFMTEAIPEDIQSKRAKIEKRAENKEKKINEVKSRAKEGAAGEKAPSKSKITAGVKKIKIQLDGIALAEKLLRNMLQTGIAGIDAQAAAAVHAQVKELGNYFINGIQTAFYDLLLQIKQASGRYEESIKGFLYISSLLKNAKAHLTEKVENPEKTLVLDTSSAIEEQIGYVWKLEELMLHGLYAENARLLQLAFYSYEDEARKEYVEEGYYISLQDGAIYIKKNYRPYKAVQYIKEDDSIFGLVEVPELYIYPGSCNRRIRWDGYQITDAGQACYEAAYAHAKEDYKEVVKQVKNQMKSPLSAQNPIVLLKVSKIMQSEYNKEMQVLLVDGQGNRQLLADGGSMALKTMPLLKNIDPLLLRDTAMLVRFENTIESGLLSAKPLSILTKNQIIRLVY